LGGELFSTRPYDEVSVDDLAAAAGISKGLLYHYFPSKRDLYVATLRRSADELLRATEPDPNLGPLERLEVGVDAYLGHVEDNLVGYASLLRGGIGTDSEVSAVVDETRRVMIDRILADIPLDGPAPALRLAVRGWIGFVESAGLEWAERREIERDAVRSILVRVLQAAVSGASRRSD
jgi:AcrR family transcriptional regulator